MDTGALCKALVGAQQSVAEATRRALNSSEPVLQTYYGTEAYGICTHRLDDSYVVVTVFEAAVREGHVWYQMREAAPALVEVLSHNAQDIASGTARTGDDWRSQIERFFTASPRERSRGRSSARASRRRSARTNRASAPRGEQPSGTPAIDSQSDPGLATGDEDLAAGEHADDDVSVDPYQVHGMSDASDTAEIDQEVPTDQHLYPTALQPEADDDDAYTERPSVEDIDWGISTDMSWDELVDGADQGFAGLSLDEAREQGLVDDLSED
jgi:hypothetical protein